MLCDSGRPAVEEKGLSWRPGDKVQVDVAFEDDEEALRAAARVTLSFKGRTEVRTLRGVPACGLRFGAGMWREGEGVTLVESSVEEGPALDEALTVALR